VSEEAGSVMGGGRGTNRQIFWLWGILSHFPLYEGCRGRSCFGVDLELNESVDCLDVDHWVEEMV
jgi:hypothetical protein